MKMTLLFMLICLFCLFHRAFAQPLALSRFFQTRGGLANSYRAIVQERRATVAFLGGSITFNPGWRDKVCSYLRETYPQTDFHFIAAGIPSLGSVPHAFRIQRDVLDSGKVDLLFLETAVNDRVNGTDSLLQVRALEGIIRHARHDNPSMDIVMMAFADEDKTKDYDAHRTPVEITNMELVASRYGLPSINIAREVRDKIRNGEFSWEKDFKDLHPAEFGQQLYYENIKALLRACLVAGPFASRSLPPPLDPGYIGSGSYDAVEHARYDSGWTLDRDWVPLDKAYTRPGFVHVPVLESTVPGASLSLSFSGTAVGIAVVSGPDAGMIDYAVDGEAFTRLDLYTQWSGRLHLPWYLVLGSGLADGKHVLHIKIRADKNPRSLGNACRIVYFLANRDAGRKRD